MCVFYLGFAARNASCDRVEVVGGVSFGERDGLVAAQWVCHSDEAAREAAHRSLKLDGFLQEGKLARISEGDEQAGTQSDGHVAIDAAVLNDLTLQSGGFVFWQLLPGCPGPWP